jgi:transposase-like protein
MVTDLGQRKVALTGCPHCGQTEIVRWGTSSGLPCYRCKACARTFNALTKTPLARLRMRQKWTTQVDALIDGVGIAKAASRCGVHCTTAFPPKSLRDLRLAAPVPCGAVRRQAEDLERDRRER